MLLISRRCRRRKLDSFTLIEILVVIAIIAILAALVLTAAEGVMKQGARSRAKSEIAGMSAALENYKTDNGTYPSADTFGTGTNSDYDAGSIDGSGVLYQNSSQILYQALSGKTNYADIPVAGVTSYMNFKIGQLGNATAAAGTTGNSSTYVQDPFNLSYGYYTGDTPTGNPPKQQNPPFNSTGQFDLWSTGGAFSTTANNTNQWIENWQQ